MEDVGAVLLNSFSASVHNRVFLEAARQGVVIIFCENFRPASLLLPANRSTDTSLTRSQIELSAAMREALWHKTVTAKCTNQSAVAEHLSPSHPLTARLTSAASGPRTDKESKCARFYWSVLSHYLGIKEFRRSREGGGLNNLLNYGYTVLLARVLQRLVAVGLDPTFGVGHAVRERATPLAYDMMEPFRVTVDARIVQWLKTEAQRQAEAQGMAWNRDGALEVSPAYKKWILGFLEMPVPYQKKEIRVELLIEHVLTGFRKAVLAKRPGLYRPWKLGNTKWDGFLSDSTSQ